MKKVLIIVIVCFLFSCTHKENKSSWISLFNGENLEGWQMKFVGENAGVNFKNTFRVEDSILVVSYDDYDSFDNNFGHLITTNTFSNYLLRVEYRFVGEQVAGGPSWGYRNNGLMIHSQAAETMELNQSFPTSIEVQLLGGIGDDDRTNLNVCTPGTLIDINGEPVLEHCFNTESKVVNGEDWTVVELEVYGDSLIRHKFNGEVVIEYTNPRLDPESADYERLLSPETGDRLTKGHIAIQAESHRTEFRKIELMEL